MYALILIALFAFMVARSSRHAEHELIVIPRRISSKLTQLWEVAHHGMRENRLLRAEKALLTILQIDQKNAAAYNRLGILYAKQKEYKDAIDCFEIASSLEPTASSLHNLGLIYFETENYDKAAAAFEQALKLEDSLAARHIAYAKVQDKLGNDKLMIQELERAIELEPNSETFNLLITTYGEKGMPEESAALQRKLFSLAEAESHRRIVRPKRIVI